jgi:hypothetical protein
MPPGERSLSKLVERYHRSTESPPTRSLARLKFWSQVFCWQARLAVHEVELEAIRREEQTRLAREQAKEDVALAHAVGSGGLGVAAVALNQLIAADGTVRRDVGPRELGPLIRACLQCLSWAHGSTSDATSDAGDPAAMVERLLHQAPDDTKSRVIQGLRTLYDWNEQHQGRR